MSTNKWVFIFNSRQLLCRGPGIGKIVIFFVFVNVSMYGSFFIYEMLFGNIHQAHQIYPIFYFLLPSHLVIKDFPAKAPSFQHPQA